MRSLTSPALSGVLLFATGAVSSAQTFNYRAGGNPFGITFFGSRGWVAEDGGRIRYTDDGGDTWIQADVDDSVRGQLRGIQFVSSLEGFCVGDGGVLLKSTDGGESWDWDPQSTIKEPFPVSGGLPATLHQVYFHDVNDGWVMGDNMVLYHTTNGGAVSPDDWTRVQPLMAHNGDIYDIAFPDPLSPNLFVLALDYGILDWTDDGGVSWEQFVFDPCEQGVCPVPGGDDCNLEIWSVDFYDELHGFAVGGVNTNNGYILRTTDGGLSWTNENCMEFGCALPPCEPVPTFYGNVATGTGTALTVGYASSVMRRTELQGPDGICGCEPEDVGWEQTNVPEQFSNPPGNWIALAGADTAFATAHYGRLRKITNGGTTIVEKGSTAWNRIEGGRFVSTSTGFLVGQDRVILKTTDGGDTLTIVDDPVANPGQPNYLNAVDVSGSVVVAVGDGGIIRRSGNNGNAGTWTAGTGQRNVAFHGVRFKPNGQVVAVGNSGVIDRSIDGGQTWSALATLSVDLYDIHFISNSNGIVVGANKYAATTTNGGGSWTPVSFDDSATPTLRAVTGGGGPVTAVGDNGSVYRLFEGVFKVQTLGAAATNLQLTDVALVPGTDDICVTGDQGLVLYYDGSGWSAPKSYMGGKLVSVDMFSANSGIITGFQTGILSVE